MPGTSGPQVCTRCGVAKDIDQYHHIKGGYRRNICRVCIGTAKNSQKMAEIESRITRCLAVLAEYGALNSLQLHDALPDISIISIAGAMNVAARAGRCARTQLNHPCRIEWSTLDHAIHTPPKPRYQTPKCDWNLSADERERKARIAQDHDEWFAALQRDVSAKQQARGGCPSGG